MDAEQTYFSQEALAIRLGLPLRFIRQMADQNKIPYLVVGGRRRFNPAAVKAALDQMAEEQTRRKGGNSETN
jgi:excisionase family DNA binding protein